MRGYNCELVNHLDSGGNIDKEPVPFIMMQNSDIQSLSSNQISAITEITEYLYP